MPPSPDPPQPKPFYIRAVGPVAEARDLQATVSGVLSRSPASGSLPERTIGFERVEVIDGVYTFKSTEPVLATVVPGLNLETPAVPSSIEASKAIPVEVAGLVDVRIAGGAYTNARRQTEVSGIEIVAPVGPQWECETGGRRTNDEYISDQNI